MMQSTCMACMTMHGRQRAKHTASGGDGGLKMRRVKLVKRSKVTDDVVSLMTKLHCRQPVSGRTSFMTCY